MYYHDYPIMNGHDSVWGLMMGLILIVFIGIVLAIVVATVRGNGAHSQKTNSLDIVKDRYARGEINKQEYEELKKDLK